MSELLSQAKKKEKSPYPAPYWNEKHLLVVFIVALVLSGLHFGWT